jgi:hypothetical protein
MTTVEVRDAVKQYSSDNVILNKLNMTVPQGAM